MPLQAPIEQDSKFSDGLLFGVVYLGLLMPMLLSNSGVVFRSLPAENLNVSAAHTLTVTLERHLEIHGVREDDECLATAMPIDRHTARDDDVQYHQPLEKAKDILKARLKRKTA
eukprot:CAMPEP_0198283200 /NCGR_PEP_ID=MMETSP1449-20131203/2863_1 /TAXON_ID=420275 /ORGANISM="Attheya septentrionalis, Strain CCMP2084" /LENGTH=113 /DNA_ID=CAMNT_0043979743 /DNA_START=145 /DNA_END=487 /DNA_ORIENTATION=-